MSRFRALLEYDGTAYSGWQRQQPSQPTVQGEVEHALRQITGQPVAVTGSGRTDSGVHARGQVISFDVTWRHREKALQRALNANLPADIAVLQLSIVHPTFHPRFDARKRVYHYHVYNQALRSPLRRRYAWHVRRNLDVAAMNGAAQTLVGEHDFATFGRPPEGTITVRSVFAAYWQEVGELLVFEIAANAFLYRMVRSIVGSLKLVGEGTWSVAEFEQALHEKDRGCCGPVAPPHGLYLVSVHYDDK